jgi:very-short-patch-repair endonuclease
MRLVRSSGLPLPVAQFEVATGSSFVARVDFAYPHLKLAIELDGYEFHHGKTAWRRDLSRRSALARVGWRVMHVTSADLTAPEKVVDDLREALGRNLLS